MSKGASVNVHCTYIYRGISVASVTWLILDILRIKGFRINPQYCLSSSLLQASVAFEKYQSKLTSMQERLEVIFLPAVGWSWNGRFMLMGMRMKGRMNVRNGEFLLIRIRIVMIIVNEYPQDSGSLLYPSVTFCTKYIWQSFPGVRRIFKGSRVFQG